LDYVEDLENKNQALREMIEAMQRDHADMEELIQHVGSLTTMVQEATRLRDEAYEQAAATVQAAGRARSGVATSTQTPTAVAESERTSATPLRPRRPRSQSEDKAPGRPHAGGQVLRWAAPIFTGEPVDALGAGKLRGE
jgi:hypothetical protein